VALIATGEGLVPDCAGCYEAAGLYNGSTYYRRCDQAYFIWMAVMGYELSSELGVETAAYWIREPAGGPLGSYFPYGTAEGTATISAP